jgi:hypothetical protein
MGAKLIVSNSLRQENRLSVFENRVLSKLFETERDEVTGEWRRLHNEECYDLYCSPNIKSKTTEWMRHVALTRRVYTGFLLGYLREKGHSENLGVDGSIILKRIFKK